MESLAYAPLMKRGIDDPRFAAFLDVMIKALYEYFKVPSVLLIDEYDVPLQGVGKIA